MENKKEELANEEKIISFNFSEEDSTAEEVSFLSGPVKSYSIDEEEKEEIKIDDKPTVRNRREPIGIKKGSVISTDTMVLEPVVEKVAEEEKKELVIEKAAEEEKKKPVIEKVAEEEKSEPVIEKVAEEEKSEPVIEKVAEEEKSEPVVQKAAEEEKAVAEEESEPVFAAASQADNSGSENDEDEEEIVFAVAQAPVRKTKIAQQKAVKKKSSFPFIPLAVSAAVLCLAAGGAFLVLNGNKGPEVEKGNESLVSQEAKDAGASNQENVIQTLPVLREEAADIKTIDTSTIVFGDNVTVSGVKVAGMTLSQAYEALQKAVLDLRDDINIEINCSGKSMTLTQDDFEFDTDLSNVLIQAYHYSRGELDNPTVVYAENGSTTDFSVMSVINKNSISAAVKKVSDKFDVQPQDAHVKSFNPDKREKFTYAEGSDGYLISQKTVQEEITAILEKPEKKGGFSVTAVRTPYTKTLEAVKANTKLIGSHCTTANNVWASVFNMELAIKSCNGYVVKPGETFSFNKMTGDTTTGDLGYVPSTAIVGGKYEQQYGGGICQAATTIYIAAMKAGMEAVERHAHQYASVYADRGIDATVDYGNLDMKFKNNFEYPIYIATYVYDYNGDGCDELCVEFYGPISAEYDEIVPVGWINYIGNSDYGAAGAQVYFKDGKEVKRVYLPEGSYDYHGEGYYTLESMMPGDPEFGPKNVSPTGETPTIYSPNGCGSSAPVPYGTASDYLSHASIQQSSNSSDTSASTNDDE